MASEAFVCIDSGTSVVKCVAFDADCNQVATAAVPNEYANLPDGGVEQDMSLTWGNCVKVLSQVASQLRDADKKVAAVSVTGQGDGTWLVDKDGKPVCDALLWLDVRAAGVVKKAEESGARKKIFAHTGCGLNACNQSAQLAWLKEHNPASLAVATTAMHCKDWLYYNLTGERCTDVSEGLFTFGDFRTGEYADDILEMLDIAECRELLPPMVDGSATQHPLGKDAAELVGLPAGTPVVLGNVDVVCSAYGGGIYATKKNVGCSIIGSTGMHMRFVDDAKSFVLPDKPSGYTMVPSGFANGLMRMQSNMSATLNIDWLAKVFSEVAGLFGAKAEKKEAIAILDKLAANAHTGILYHPYIQAGERGPFFNPDAKAQFLGIDIDAGAAELVRAVYEGLAFACRHCYEATGKLPGEVRISGGGGRSKALRQVHADVLGAKVRVSKQDETSAVGAAMIAAVATGLFPDMASACKAWPDSHLGGVVLPDEDGPKRYGAMYGVYRTAAENSNEMWHELALGRSGVRWMLNDQR